MLVPLLLFGAFASAANAGGGGATTDSATGGGSGTVTVAGGGGGTTDDATGNSSGGGAVAGGGGATTDDATGGGAGGVTVSGGGGGTTDDSSGGGFELVPVSGTGGGTTDDASGSGAQPFETNTVLSLARVKQHLEYEDDDRDEYIAGLMEAAEAWVEGFTGLLLRRRTVTRDVLSEDNWRLAIGPDPVVTGVGYVDASLADQVIASGFRLSRGRMLFLSAPSAPYGVTVTVTAGFDKAAVPGDLRHAMLLLIGHWFANREAVAVAVSANEVPLAVESLCRPHRLIAV